MSHSPKYDEAAAFKGHLDSTFRRHETMTVPYTLNDGAMMALTNMSAAGRIRLMPIDLPNIPLGFEPGNYESRKYPKSYYYFALEVVPTETYEYNEDIEVLHAVTRESPPTESLRGELPQWVSLLGQSNTQRWSEMLALSTLS
ncbi:hypothetical protein CDD83_1075 [Cordyceps sp. RAO-2017]|nr:hypothetical protein CDD83_1075 [Cordyceps sp. RAO-2017]